MLEFINPLVLLYRYLVNLYTPPEAEQAYRALLQKLEELTHLSQGLLRIYHGLNASEMDPLLHELFDLT
ncbi:unnamed protein product [Gongylonema pulchrum]|uniref:Circadian clock protein KaiA n=1 Tax=Gongylonema pulchrum TaxID=637853 RepID=A0A183DN31_9BILA|nr:unnamed protein product [Gongylonema pulchrum]